MDMHEAFCQSILILSWLNLNSLPLAASFLISLAPISQAAIQVVDPVDSPSVSTSHAGADILVIDLSTDNLGFLAIGDSPSRVGTNISATISFTQGASLSVFSPVNRVEYREAITDNFLAGAALGLNYVRVDLDDDNVYETVVELSFDSVLSTNRNVITRYAYDDTGASLDIPDAVVALNAIPEPSSVVLVSACGLLLLKRRRKS